MSRLTAAQVIGLGQYLEPDFEPASLTVSQLLGVLGYHNIPYPTPYSKPKLVQVFNDEIKGKATKWKKERLKKDNSIASDEGILDGATGEPLRKETTAVRRSSRRLSRAPLEEDDTESTSRPEPSKRRRSSAQPTLGGPSRKLIVAQETLAEESEPEEDLPPRKIGRSKKTSDGVKARRISNAAEDSGWEDNNIFQSAAESSSPARPSPVRPRAPRQSVTSKKSRKSQSVPPQMAQSPPKSFPVPVSPFSPPSTSFKPQIFPASPFLGGQRLGFPQSTPEEVSLPRAPSTPPKEEEVDDQYDDVVHIPDAITEASQETENDNVAPALGPSDDELAVAESISQEGGVVSTPVQAEGGSFILRLVYILLGGLACYSLAGFKEESASIGYCDPGSRTNHALEELKLQRLAVEACHRENGTSLYLPPLLFNTSAEAKEGQDTAPCALAPLVPWLLPESCTPCPEHANCSQFSVTCDLGYMLRPHPLVFFLPPSGSPRSSTFSLSASPVESIWKTLSVVLDGLPGFGSVALPPRCVEDPKRKRHIGALGKAIESLLGQERGRRLCSGRGDHPVKDTDGGDAKKWGYELDELRDLMRKKAPPHLRETFDDTFNEAIQQLSQWGGVIIGEDRENHRYVAHRTPGLTWDCMITVKSRELWQEWRATVLGTVLATLGLLYARAKASQKRRDSKRVAELVQIALDTLRNQELAYHTDPVTAVQPYLSSLQLRDLILQEEHSVSSRSRLWNQVERVVEGNANVRTNLEEIAGGDEMRVWRWVGSAGRRVGLEVKKEGPADQQDIDS